MFFAGTEGGGSIIITGGGRSLCFLDIFFFFFIFAVVLIRLIAERFELGASLIFRRWRVVDDGAL